MKQKWIVLVALFAIVGFSNHARADEIANVLYAGSEFLSANGLAKVVIDSTLTSFSVWLSGKELYKLAVPFKGLKRGSFFVKDDGKSVVWMLSGHAYGDTKGSDLALIFYREGKQMKSYTFGELIVRPKLVSHSMSHMTWIMEYRTNDYSPSGRLGAQIIENENKFELNTTSFREYLFDVESGKTLIARDSEAYTKADAIVYATVKEDGRKIQLNEIKLIKDTSNTLTAVEVIQVTDPTKSFYDGSGRTIFLKKKSDGWEISHPRWTNDILYNEL